ncbi:ferrochelatase, mitochondrial [Leptopilina boulardi]|uniref:ferrochelatase, mitochondrial n=1 Tax=Leptopilina boulardi TaxID=63433 RepID=UPI0021F651A7|nr:ferrochelatase, mitochondrial [Leptopilina boulardi]
MIVSNLRNLLNIGNQNSNNLVPIVRTLALASQPKHRESEKPKTAILMLNMGGPSKLDQVHEYLLRIMTDRDMVQMPFQSFLAPLIAKGRTPEVMEKYKEIGGCSPILKWTNKQGKLLCEQLDQVSPETAPHKYYVAFRYADPLTDEALKQIEIDDIQRTVIFSQYPQYSCATSGSSLTAIYKYYKEREELLNGMKLSVIDRWSTHPLLVKVFAERIKEEMKHFPKDEQKDVTIMFSAHSLPLEAVQRGDSYPSEIGATVQLVMQELKFSNPYILTWQSKVGPVKWLSPFTDESIELYTKVHKKKNFILVPIAFVNEHIETLHEMDIEFCKDIGEKLGINIRRAAAPNDHPIFINALTDIVATHLKSHQMINPKMLTRCPHCTNPNCEESKSWFERVCQA